MRIRNSTLLFGFCFAITSLQSYNPSQAQEDNCIIDVIQANECHKVISAQMKEYFGYLFDGDLNILLGPSGSKEILEKALSTNRGQETEQM